jgi:hypothetical protein
MDIIRLLRIILASSIFLSLYLSLKSNMFFMLEIQNFYLEKFLRVNFIEIYLLILFIILIIYIIFKRWKT